jgi:hypothetical protein
LPSSLVIYDSCHSIADRFGTASNQPINNIL